ncbi:MAG: serine hydroxymethyltransferase [Patescibacteria group bacterium]
MLEYINKQDKTLADLIAAELHRQRADLQMIPSENFTSLAVLEALGSVLTNKYSEGYPGKRYYGGNYYIDQIENLARQRACQLFNVAHANVQAYSGSPANQAVYFALLKPGDKVMGLELSQGGHLTHGYKLNFSGKYYKPLGYNLNPQTHLLDYELIRQAALTYKPKLIVCGATAYPRQIDFGAFRKIADEVQAYLLADISHISGLIISGDHPSPVPYADVIMTTTHKTLRGPRGALILVPNKQDRWHDLYRPKSKKNLAELIDSAIIPGLQGGPHNHQTAAIAVALQEAMTDSYKNYGHQIVANAQALADSLLANGFKLITGGTDNHLILMDLTEQGLTGQQAEKVLDSVGITVNKNLIPYDTRSPLDPSGLRLGTPALTSRGLMQKEMTVIGQLINQTIKNWTNQSVLDKIKKQVKELSDQFPLYPEIK